MAMLLIQNRATMCTMLCTRYLEKCNLYIAVSTWIITLSDTALELLQPSVGDTWMETDTCISVEMLHVLQLTVVFNVESELS